MIDVTLVVPTLPSATSGWLAVDLPRRVERLTGARVTHVVALPSPSPAGRDRWVHSLPCCGRRLNPG